MKLSFFRRRSWKKHLAVAVTAGILAGAYAPGAWAESGNYNNQGSKPGVTKTVTEDINVIVHSSNYSAQGIAVGYGAGSALKPGDQRFVSIFNGNVTMKDASYAGGWGITAENIHGGYPVYRGARWQPSGIRAGLCGDVIVNGDLDLAVYGSGLVTDPYYTLKDGTPEVNGSTINVNGNVKIVTPELATEAFYAVANYGGTININASGTKDVVLKGNIITMKNDTGSRAPFFVDGITNITLNNKDSIWTGVVDNTGKAQTGEINLTLANGAKWEHESLSMTNGLHVETMPNPSNENYGTYDGVSYLTSLTGGTNAENTGHIYATSSAAINIANYSGYTTVYYAHENAGTASSDYSAGDVIIGNAAEKSGITLVTASNGVNTSDIQQVNNVLNVLAGKLTYTGYSAAPENLTGTVKLAGSLTGDVVVLKEGNIIFNDSGKGTYIVRKSNFNTTLTGDIDADGEYASSGIIQADGSYKFETDSKITVADDTGSGAKGIASAAPLVVDAAGKTLTIDVKANHPGMGEANAIYQSGNNSITITADKLLINTFSNADKANGIGADNTFNPTKQTMTVNGDVDININSSSGAGIKTRGNAETIINGDLTVKTNGKPYNYYSGQGIYASTDYGVGTGKYERDFGGVVVVNGATNISGNGAGVVANGGGSVISLNGDVNITAVANRNPALIAESATINVNQNGGKKVNISGNIVANTHGEADTEAEKNTVVNLNMDTKESTLTGVAFNAFPLEGVGTNHEAKGYINLGLSNGATWNNEQKGGLQLYSDYEISNGWYPENTIVAFAGSHISTFKGGTSAETAGNIFQKDSKDLTIDNYSGVTNIYYAHTNDGTLASDYDAYGDTIINHAAANSLVNLITNAPSSITVDSITNVLNALAGKLTYGDAVDSKTDLTGIAKMAGGLTTDSVEIAYGNILFSETDGKGIGVEKINLADAPEKQVASSFNTTMTGKVDTDLEYRLGGVMKGEGSYKFEEDSNITVVDSSGNGAKGIAAAAPMVIDAAGKTLTIDVKANHPGMGEANAIYQSGNNSITITADKLLINTFSNADKANGIGADNTFNPTKQTMTVNGDVDININSSSGAGIKTRGNAETIINGDLTVKTNGKPYNYYSGQGIYASTDYGVGTGKYERDFGGVVVVNGATNISGNGAGVVANGGGSVISLNGDVNITAVANRNPALIAESATINVNQNGGKKVNISGNIVANTHGEADTEAEKNTVVNLNMDTKESTLTGVAFNAFPLEGVGTNHEAKGYINLGLSNGATWNNEQKGGLQLYSDYEISNGWYPENTIVAFAGSHISTFKGGTSAETAGNIFQKDSKDLTIDNYSGVTNIYYAHTNDGTLASDYDAYGDTIIKHAEKGSIVNLITNGSAQTSEESLGKILSALAGKLTYANYVNGENNLKGTVTLAAGLTTGSVVWALSDIVFDAEQGGMGTVVIKDIELPEPPKEQGSNTSFNSTLNGGMNLEYHHGGVTQDDGYKFTENTSINIKDGNVAIEGTNDIKINAADKTLTLTVKPTDAEAVSYGVKQENAGNINIEAGKLSINVTGVNGNEGIRLDNVQEGQSVTTIKGSTEINLAGSASSKGITVNGNSALNIQGNLSINNSSTVAGEDAGNLAIGIYAGSKEGAPDVGAVINVDGATVLQGNGTGVAAIGGGSTVNLNGSTDIETGSDDMPAIVADGGIVNINKGTANNNTVNIKGNLLITKNQLAADGTGADSTINIKMDNSNSSWTGIAYNAFKDTGVPPQSQEEVYEESEEEANGEQEVAPIAVFSLRSVSFAEENAATTTAGEAAATTGSNNSATGAINLELSNGAVWTNELVGNLPVSGGAYSGSYIAEFKGGSDYSHSGYIVQKDSNALTIANYSGSAILVYEHTKVDENTFTFNAGNTTIQNAAAGSLITLSTDNKDIDTNNKEQVEKVMSTLAQKLIYAASDSDTNLQGQVQIAGSLTSDKVALWLGDLTFGTDNIGKFTEGSSHTAFTIVDEEAESSKGVRGAITSNLNNWRDLASSSFTLRDAKRIRQAGGGRGPVDSGTRLGAADEGTWARVYGGQSKYSGNNTSYDGNNWAAQVGYDKQLSNGWNVGLALDYQDGSVSYTGGSGDTELYGLSIMGSKELANNSFLDLAMRLGHVKNEFSASETNGGDYSATGYSLSAQYSKRFGDVDSKGYVEPQLQFTWSRMGSADFDMQDIFNQKYSVKQDAFNSFVARLGVEVGQASDYGHYYARLSLGHEFAGDMDTHFADQYGRTKDRSFDLGGTWTEITLGGTYNISENMSFYGDVSKTLSGDYKNDWKVNAGLRFTF